MTNTTPSTTPTISIVIPVYNLEFYIERCLDSVARQTLAGVEALVVNDGGSDDSQLIIDEYVARYPSLFRSFIKENGGHGSACNYGIERARGEYVMILDGDDFLDPDTSEVMYQHAKATGCDLLIGNLTYVFSTHTEPFKPVPLGESRVLTNEDRALLYRNWATPCGRIYARSLFDDPDLRFLPGIIFADANFVPKSYYAASRIAYLDRSLYNYDVTRPTQSMKQTDKRVLNIVPALRDMLEYYRKKGAFDAYRDDLTHYVARHCVSWIVKVQHLTGYPRGQAIRELFTVADEAFGDTWITSGAVEQHFGKAMALRMRAARATQYRSIIWEWHAERRWRRADTTIEDTLNRPAKAYRFAKRWVYRRATGKHKKKPA